MIRNINLDHKGGFYLYCIHEDKVNLLCNDFKLLSKYLDYVFKECPNSFFNYGPRSSMLRFKSNIALKRIKGHEVSMLAYYGLRENHNIYKSGHLRVQMFMLENDDKTIATEIPIWLNHNELDSYELLFKTRDPLTGHIDILRIEDNKIWVWDYKPNADKEEFAMMQILFYAIMLSKRTKIDLDQFRCGYFDANNAYVFKPEISSILEQNLLTRYI